MNLVRHRLVFFISGFDPKGASSFYQQHKLSLAEHNERHGVAYTLGPRTKSHDHAQAWTLRCAEGAHTDFEYLAWDDLVRTQWARTTGAVVRQACGCLKDFVLTGTIRQMYAMSRNTARAALFPYLLVLIAVATVVLLTATVAWVAHVLLLSNLLTTAVTGCVLLSCGWVAVRWLKSIPSTWFLRVVAFARTYASANKSSDPMQQRIASWSQYLIAQVGSSAADEVLLIGYSAGSILGMALMARLWRDAPECAVRISLLTLGNCIPATAALPKAAHVRQDLLVLDQKQARWVDITSPIDWGSFALNDTVAVVAGGQASEMRKSLSPQWHLLFSARHYQLLKKDKYRVHKQYLRTTDILGAYDYFGIICGPTGLCERFFSATK
jgi:hypothetical protein